MNNKLYIAAAGSGKTSLLVDQAISMSNESVLITTFTESNALEIQNKIIKKIGYVPKNISITTWFTFLLKHFVRPYQDALDAKLFDKNIGFILVNEKSGKKLDSDGNPILSNGNPMYWGNDNVERCYLTKTDKLFSDKISKFSVEANKASNGNVINRVSRIFKNIFVDEVQDLVGYDLDILKLLFSSPSNIILVGDPRQVTYTTHFSTKHKKYGCGNIKDFINNELGKRLSCDIDETTLSMSHRNPNSICLYSSRLFPKYPQTKPCSCTDCRKNISHEGVYVISKAYAESYLKTYKPTQLRWSNLTNINSNFPALNFGESKGLTLERVLIYPTKPMIAWIKDQSKDMTDEARAKLYVAITRAKFSAAIIIDDYDFQGTNGIVQI